MTDAMASVQALQSGAQQSAARLLAGEGVDLHQVALDQQRAAISFDLFLAVRNKVVQAYQEVMRMQV
jgi:flagellar hook-basal body complex protein FliE